MRERNSVANINTNRGRRGFSSFLMGVGLSLILVFTMGLTSCEDELPSIYIGGDDESESSSDEEPGIESDEGEELDETSVPHFIISDNDKEWDLEVTNNLNIFYNEQFNSSMIAPGSKGSYLFYIDNVSEETLYVNITLSEKNDFGVAIKYMLYVDSEPIVSSYSLVSEFKADNIALSEGKHTFTLYWWWDPDVSDEADTLAGTSGATDFYTLSIKIYGEYIDTSSDE